MIQIFTVTADLGTTDGPRAVAVLQEATDKLAQLYPALRGATVAADARVLTMTIRVAGRDRWSVSAAARKIATSMLHRVKIPAASAAIELAQTMPPGTTLTKEQGRSVVNHRPRTHRPKSWAEVPWGLDSQGTPGDLS